VTTQDLLHAGDISCVASLELMDLRFGHIADLTEDLVSGSSRVRREGAREGSVMAEYEFGISRDLPWTEVLVAPSMTVRDEATGDVQTWAMGVYLPDLGDFPRIGDVHAVTGYDLLHAIDVRIGESHRVAAGDNVLDAVRDLITDSSQWPGFSFAIGFGSSSETFAHEVVWSVTESVTYLQVANEMLALAGYRPLWTTRTGEVMTERATLLLDKPPEWIVDGTAEGGQIGDGSLVKRDIWGTPNVWKGVERSPGADAIPTEGSGRFTLENMSTGPTSVETRGRKVHRIITTDAADSDSLERVVRAAAEEDVAASTKIVLDTPPLPFVWHQTRWTVHDPKLGMIHVPAVVRKWSLPLDQDKGRMRSVSDRLYKVVS